MAFLNLHFTNSSDRQLFVRFSRKIWREFMLLPPNTSNKYVDIFLGHPKNLINDIVTQAKSKLTKRMVSLGYIDPVDQYLLNKITL